ncbi:3-deoxy-D-manno-octulosonic acid kinase [Marinicella sp. W31]|uniref:3-deoxy-D-manno-octulosonic acid kinase n=1 Tax=Marinicella sp. W31 TaxID=3023713 RepID=UPI003756998A
MPQVTAINHNQWVLLKRSLQEHIDNQWFDKDYWLAQGRLLGANSGRGSAWTIKSEHGKWVLRHYYRGGLFGKLIRDSYFWTGLNNTRSFQEFRILQVLKTKQLPAPQPIAAHVIKKGLFYRTDLIMAHIPHEMTFAQMIHECIDDIACWQLIGQTIAQFHQQHIYHSDLNTHNILLNKDKAYLIDFDKAQIMKKAGSWQNSNLDRLKRSIHKVSNLSCDTELKSHWQALMDGYQSL